MKRKLLLLWTFLLCFAAGSLAAEITIDFSAKGYGNAQEISTVVQDGVTVTFDKGTNNNTPKFYTTGNAIRVYGGGTMTVSSGSNITSIAVTFGSSDGSNALKTDVGTLTEGTWTGSSSSVVFSIGGSSGHRRFRSLTITTGEAPSIVKPTITGKTPFYGSTEVTIASTTEGAEIRYTLDGTEPTAESTLYTAPFTLSESATVKAIAVKDGNVSEAVSKAFVAMTAYSTIAEVNALSDATPFAFTGSAVVVASPSTRYTYIKDATGNSLIYTANKQFEVGSVIAPTWTGKVSIYNSLFEVVPTSELTTADGQTETVEYPEATAADITLENANKVVVLKGVTYTTPDEKKNFTITQGESTIAGYNSIGITIDAPVEGKTYDIVGAISRYKDNAQFAPIFITEAVAAEPEAPVWRDIKADFTNGAIITSEETNVISVGLSVAEDGTVSRVAADAANANAVVSGKFHSNDHGLSNFSATVKVEGPVKIGMGTCAWGGDVTVKNENGETVANTFNTNDGTCWHGTKNVVYTYYKGEAATLTIAGGSYTPYFSVEKVALEDIPTVMKVEYSLGDTGAAGVLPANFEINDGEKFATPVNRTLYVEGKTLTGWTDGTKTYAIGEEITSVADTKITLTPVFTANEVSLADRTEAVTLKWNFRRDQGAPVVAWEGKSGLIWVTQATIGGKTIDVKMDMSTSPGKFNNTGNTDCAQTNPGTKFTIPSCKGAVVSMECHGSFTISTTTIDGQTGYTGSGSTNVSYEIANTAETIDIVIGDGRYYRYVQVVLPVVEAEAPSIQERAIINTGFEDWNSVSAEGGPLDIATQFSNETITFNFVGTSCQPTGQNSKFGDETGFLMAEKNAQGTVTTTAFKNITKVRYYHGATGGSRGWGLQKKSANDADWVTISSDFANPSSGVWVEKEINEENVQLRWYNLADAQNAYMFNLEVYANVEITAEQVSLTTAVAPEEAAGKVSVYPVSSSYDVGTELKLTATENFGYDFVNWTNSVGEEVSAEPVFTYTLNANETLTANFKKVNTYELALTVEGGANDYMIAFNPAPTVVDGKNMYEAGTVVELAASSNPILTFANWGDGQTNGTISVTMDTNQTVSAIYSAGDYIVGWDFIKRGNNGRPADFASTVDNETAALIMTNASGKVSGWLDKSKEAANGYESFVGAAVNWQALADKYYYQTKINASEFMNIKVQAEMMYNYNAYQTQTIEYSIDGTNWTKVGEATMPGVKTGTPIEAVLPAEANNAPELYIRFIPDYTSQIDGTESNNDGTTITNIFIFGEKKIVDDGVAPKFVSSVPANDATGASATGKIVVNFDEKVKLTATASATLNGKAMEGTVAGKTITFPYVGLEYNTPYSFVLAAGSVADLTDNTLAEAITINFTTMDRPSVAKAEYDAIVTNIDELKDALAKATGSARFRIFLHNGTYDFKTATLTSVKGNVSLIGESTEGTILRNDPQAEGIGVTAILCTGGENIYMQDLTLMSTDYERSGNNGEGGSIGRCVVLQENASKAVYKNVNLLSHQDTYYTRATQRAYWEGGKIAGTVDYLCGGGDIFFNGVTLYNNARGNGDCITAPATSSNWGYVFSDCIIDGDADQDGRYSLGRPWQGAPRAVYLNTTMKILPTGAGWSDMGAVPALFAEFNSHTESGALVDCSARKTSFTVNGTSQSVSYNPVLTQAEAEKYTIANVVGGTDNWQPELLTEQAPAPTNVVLEGYELKWDDSKYALLWAVCKNGSVVAFVTTPTYTVDDTTAEWSVRAANEMGGLCPAVTAGESTGIENIEQAADDNAPMYNVAGQRVTKSAKGIVIQNGHKYVRK